MKGAPEHTFGDLGKTATLTALQFMLTLEVIWQV